MRTILTTLCAVLAVAGVATADHHEEALPVIFEDDFENGRDKWEVTDEKSWAIQKGKDGQGFGITRRESDYSPEVRSPLHIALIKDVEAADLEITFDVRSTLDTGGHRDCCIFFGYQDAKNFYYIHTGAKPDPAAGQIMVVDDAPRTPITENEKEFGWNDEWHKVKVVRKAESGLIEIYFDDMETPHMSATDKRFGKGRIGIGSFDDLNVFDNIVVKGK